VPPAQTLRSSRSCSSADLRSFDGQVTLGRFDSADQAIALVDRRYEQLRSDDPDLAEILGPASPHELREWHNGGQLYAIRVQGKTVGALAIAPSSVSWIERDEVSEEVIDVGNTGHGYAAAAQSAWAAQIAADRNTLLIGTIHSANVASRRTAEAVGRLRVLDDYAVALRGSSELGSRANAAWPRFRVHFTKSDYFSPTCLIRHRSVISVENPKPKSPTAETAADAESDDHYFGVRPAAWIRRDSAD
jgi:hypothetical protein